MTALAILAICAAEAEHLGHVSVTVLAAAAGRDDAKTSLATIYLPPPIRYVVAHQGVTVRPVGWPLAH